MDKKNLIAIAIGGAFGAFFRYLFNACFTFADFPIATVLANVLGSFLLGLFTGMFMKRVLPEWIKLGFGTGVCGGFTTMSTFMADAFFLWDDSQWMMLFAYVFFTLFGGLLSAYSGLFVSLKIIKGDKGGE